MLRVSMASLLVALASGSDGVCGDPSEAAGTFNGFHGVTTGPKIDYVFAEAEAHVSAAEILRDNMDGRYPSDHFPVTADIVFSGGAH
jgi:endonuclease/exonuclease/phosphatase family metal-dependent hydrolase